MNKARILFLSAQLLLGASLHTGLDAWAQSMQPLKPCPLDSAETLAQCISAERLDTFKIARLLDNDARVLVFGETHFANAHRHELVEALPSLRRLGFSHLALEVMPSSRKDLIAGYKAGLVPRAELVAAIKRIWGHKPESYVDLIDSALALDFEVVFLDSDRERIDLDAPNWQELQRQARARREDHWMDIMSLLLQTGKNRVIMLVGSGHNASRAATPPVRLRLSARNIKSTSIALEGGEAFIDSKLTRAARKAGIAGTRFIVKVEPGDSDAEGDYHLHLRQAKKRTSTTNLFLSVFCMTLLLLACIPLSTLHLLTFFRLPHKTGTDEKFHMHICDLGGSMEHNVNTTPTPTPAPAPAPEPEQAPGWIEEHPWSAGKVWMLIKLMMICMLLIVGSAMMSAYLTLEKVSPRPASDASEAAELARTLREDWRELYQRSVDERAALETRINELNAEVAKLAEAIKQNDRELALVKANAPTLAEIKNSIEKASKTDDGLLKEAKGILGDLGVKKIRIVDPEKDR